MNRLGSFALCAIVAASACGSDIDDGGGGGSGGNPPPLSGLRSIAIQPATSTVTIDGDTPATVDYVARGTFSDGRTADISTRVGWSLNNAAIGSFKGARFTSSTVTGGHVVVTAINGNITASASLAVVLK